MRLLRVKDLYWLCVLVMLRVAGWIPWTKVRQAMFSEFDYLV